MKICSHHHRDISRLLELISDDNDIFMGRIFRTRYNSGIITLFFRQMLRFENRLAAYICT